MDVRPDGRRSAHPGPLADPGGVKRHGAHAWERGGVREVRRAEGGLHVSGRNADGPEAGVEQRIEGDVEVDASGPAGTSAGAIRSGPARSAGGSSRSAPPGPAGPAPPQAAWESARVTSTPAGRRATR